MNYVIFGYIYITFIGFLANNLVSLIIKRKMPIQRSRQMRKKMVPSDTKIKFLRHEKFIHFIVV